MQYNKTIWGIHAGSMGEVDRLFLSKTSPCIAIGWSEFGDFRKVENNREAFKLAFKRIYPESKIGAIPTTAGMLYRFIYEIQINDLIAYPSKHDKHIHIGRITGQYEFSTVVNKDYPQIRKVEWLKHIPRSEFSQGALYEIGSALSLFQIKNYADEYFALLDGTQTISENEVDTTISDVTSEIEQSTRDFIFKKLSKELKGYPFEHFIAHILNIIGYKTKVSPEGGDGGIDIIAFKDELGIEPPIIKVQVKSYDGTVTPDKVQALYGNVENGEYGLFISLSTYSKQATVFAKSKSNLRLIDGDELIDLILNNYEKIDSKYKAKIPLKKVYIPTQDDNE